jgi:hypothetical protein
VLLYIDILEELNNETEIKKVLDFLH